MKALILKDVYTIRFQFIVTFSLFFVCQMALIEESVFFAIFLCGLYSSLLLLTTYQDMFTADEKSKWDTFMLSLPLARKRIVDEKFVVLAALLFFIFIIHTIILSLALTYSEGTDQTHIFLALSIEISILMILYGINISAYVSKLLSTGKFDCLLSILIIMLASAACTAFTYWFLTSVLHDMFVTPGIIIKYHAISLICIMPVLAGAYMFCRTRINKREY